MTSARFWQVLPLPSIERPPSPDDLSICQTPPFQSDISFSKNPLHSTLIETLNVYLIQLKTERCQVNFMCNHSHIQYNRDKRKPAISLGEYINTVVSRIVIGPLDLKQVLPKFKYFC